VTQNNSYTLSVIPLKNIECFECLKKQKNDVDLYVFENCKEIHVSGSYGILVEEFLWST